MELYIILAEWRWRLGHTSFGAK